MRPVRIHGGSPAERGLARAKRAAKRRVSFFSGLVSTAPTQMQRLSRACDYARAVAGHLPDDQVKRMATAIARLAEQAEKEGGRL